MESITVATYNVRHAALDEEGTEWERRRTGVANRLRQAEPDVVGVQECAGDQQTELAGALPAYDWAGVATSPGSGKHVPIGYRRDWRLLDTETNWLSETGTPGSVGWDAEYPRVLTEATLRHRPTGRSLTVYNTHFDHLGRRARRESAGLVREQLDSLPEGRPAVVLGDFNAEPGSPTYDRLLSDGGDRQLADARTSADTVTGPETTLTDFESLRPDRAVDHVFVTPELSVEAYRVDSTTENGRYPSDHLPVVVTASW